MLSQMNKFKYIENVTPEIGTIKLYGKIGDPKGTLSSNFVNEISYLEDHCKKISILVNSEGGNVLEGYSIYSSIINSSVETESKIVGLAASTAGWCAMAANTCLIEDYGTLMIHGVKDESAKPDKALEQMINGSIATMLSNRSGMTIDEANALMDKETFYRAFNKADRKTLIDKKLVDEIVTTTKKIKEPKKLTLSNLVNIYNPSTKENNMKEINNLLKLANEASEGEAAVAIKAIQTENDSLKTEIAALKKEKTDAEASAKLALTNEVTAFANQLVADKKIKEEEKASVITNASASKDAFAFVKNTFDKIGTVKEPKKIFNAADVKNDSDDRASWDFNKWSKEDPAGLAKMQNETPEAFNTLVSKISTNFNSKR